MSRNDLMDSAMRQLKEARQGGDHASIDSAILFALSTWDPMHEVGEYVDDLIDAVLRQSPTRDDADVLMDRVTTRLGTRFSERLDDVLPGDAS